MPEPLPVDCLGKRGVNLTVSAVSRSFVLLCRLSPAFRGCFVNTGKKGVIREQIVEACLPLRSGRLFSFLNRGRLRLFPVSGNRAVLLLLTGRSDLLRSKVHHLQHKPEACPAVNFRRIFPGARFAREDRAEEIRGNKLSFLKLLLVLLRSAIPFAQHFLGRRLYRLIKQALHGRKL